MRLAELTREMAYKQAQRRFNELMSQMGVAEDAIRQLSETALQRQNAFGTVQNRRIHIAYERESCVARADVLNKGMLAAQSEVAAAQERYSGTLKEVEHFAANIERARANEKSMAESLALNRQRFVEVSDFINKAKERLKRARERAAANLSLVREEYLKADKNLELLERQRDEVAAHVAELERLLSNQEGSGAPSSALTMQLDMQNDQLKLFNLRVDTAAGEKDILRRELERFEFDIASAEIALTAESASLKSIEDEHAELTQAFEVFKKEVLQLSASSSNAVMMLMQEEKSVKSSVLRFTRLQQAVTVQKQLLSSIQQVRESLHAEAQALSAEIGTIRGAVFEQGKVSSVLANQQQAIAEGLWSDNPEKLDVARATIAEYQARVASSVVSADKRIKKGAEEQLGRVAQTGAARRFAMAALPTIYKGKERDYFLQAGLNSNEADEALEYKNPGTTAGSNAGFAAILAKEVASMVGAQRIGQSVDQNATTGPGGGPGQNPQNADPGTPYHNNTMNGASTVSGAASNVTANDTSSAPPTSNPEKEMGKTLKDNILHSFSSFFGYGSSPTTPPENDPNAPLVPPETKSDGGFFRQAYSRFSRELLYIIYGTSQSMSDGDPALGLGSEVENRSSEFAKSNPGVEQSASFMGFFFSILNTLGFSFNSGKTLSSSIPLDGEDNGPVPPEVVDGFSKEVVINEEKKNEGNLFQRLQDAYRAGDIALITSLILTSGYVYGEAINNPYMQAFFQAHPVIAASIFIAWNIFTGHQLSNARNKLFSFFRSSEPTQGAAGPAMLPPSDPSRSDENDNPDPAPPEGVGSGPRADFQSNSSRATAEEEIVFENRAATDGNLFFATSDAFSPDRIAAGIAASAQRGVEMLFSRFNWLFQANPNAEPTNLDPTPTSPAPGHDKMPDWSSFKRPMSRPEDAPKRSRFAFW